MTVQSAQSVTVLFTTRVFATGVGTIADSLPTGALYQNGTVNAATVTVTNISGGLYKAQVTMPTLAAGDEVELAITATVSSITDTAVIWGDTNDFIGSSGALTTVTTATNLTNAPTAGDLTATMKSSVTTAVNAATTVGITSNRKKGSTATFEFLMQDATTGAPKTGLTVASTISKDGGAPASTTNSVTEIGLGQYQIVLTNTEMTANNVFLQFTSSGAITANLSIQTQP